MKFRALERKKQLDSIKEFRPFWQLVGPCAEKGRRTYFADDQYWDTGCAPWNCPKPDCGCRVDSLTRTELARYVQSGVTSDPSSAELLKKWDALNPNRVTCTVTIIEE